MTPLYPFLKPGVPISILNTKIYTVEDLENFLMFQFLPGKFFKNFKTFSNEKLLEQWAHPRSQSELLPMV